MSSSYDPRRPDPDFDPEDHYGFAPGSEPPTAPPVEPEPDSSADHTPRQKKRKRSKPDSGEVALQHRDRILDREETPSPVPWWVASLAIGLVGLLMLLGPLLVLVIREKSATLGAVGLAVIGVVSLGATLAMTGLLVVIGSAFGIEYGAWLQAIVKLVALTLFVNGQTLLVALVWFPCAHFIAILIAGILAGATAYGLFMLLFRLSVHESLLTVGGIVVGSWILNFAAAGLLGVVR